MEKGTASSLFVNDGSFMERFKQLQEEQEKSAKRSSPTGLEGGTPKPVSSKPSVTSKANDSRKPSTPASSGKLAFSLKQKSKLVAPPVKLDEDEDENEEERDAGYGSGNGPTKRQRVGQPDASLQSSKQVDVGKYFLYTVYFIWSIWDFLDKSGRQNPGHTWLCISVPSDRCGLCMCT